MMPKSSPDVIFIVNYHGLANTDKNNFYRCKNSNANIISYLERMKSKDNFSNSEIEKINNYLELSNAASKNILNYQNFRPGSTGSFNQKGMLEKDDLKKIYSELATTKSLVWDAVLSFTPQVAEKICSSKNQAQKLIKDNLQYLFQNSNIDFNNIKWLGSFHLNTDNPHIHLVLWEKDPKYIDSQGKRSYTKIGKIDKEYIDNFKYKICDIANLKTFNYYNLRDDTRRNLRLGIQNSKFYMDTFYKKTLPIIEKGHFQYARLDDKDKNTIDVLIKDFIKIRPDLADNVQLYKNNLADHQAHIVQNFMSLHQNVPDRAKNFYNERVNDFNVRLANEFLKIMKDYHNSQNNNSARKNTKSLASSRSYNSLIRAGYRENERLLHKVNELLTVFSGTITKQIDFRSEKDDFIYNKMIRGDSLIYE